MVKQGSNETTTVCGNKHSSEAGCCLTTLFHNEDD